MRAPGMLKSLAAGAIALGLVVPAQGKDKGKTSLSGMAAQIKVGTSREKVVATLGPATWAVLAADGGPMSIKDLPGVALQLQWKAGASCFPVTVIFDADMTVSGVDAGNCVEQKLDPGWLPGAEYSCSKEDRAALCRP